MNYIPRFLQFPGYETRNFKDFHQTKIFEIYLVRRPDKEFRCFRCGCELQGKHNEYSMKIRHLPVFDFTCFIYLRRSCGYCVNCKKVRAEAIDFVSAESPHLTKDFTWWLGSLCEISAVTNAAGHMDVDAMTTWRVDFKRMLLMLKFFRPPKVTHVSVDEVYARNKPKKGESRDDRFFTVISDLKTRRVLWVSESRRKEGLDEYFKIIGPEACKAIKVVAMDQHNAYKASVNEHCPKAAVVWDRFHLMQTFNEVLNEIRKDMFELAQPGSTTKKLLRGKHRYIFLKKASRRTPAEAEHLETVTQRNRYLLQLELIKERLITFFDAHDLKTAKEIFSEIEDWVRDIRLPLLTRWFENLKAEWKTLQNYFEYRVTSALSEGINNVIKALKRAAYGYKNMTYFRLKIMQKCGYLNSKYIQNMDALMEGL